MKKKDYEKAAATYKNPVLKAAALYREGRFKDAAVLFARDTARVSLFNKGTALIMAGLYDDAIESFEMLLETDPEFEPALINLEIARKRKQRPPEDDHGGTGGMLEADDFVFSDRKIPASNEEKEEVDSASTMSEAETRALWLRRLESSPKDFLRVKFAYQQAINQDTP